MSKKNIVIVNLCCVLAILFFQGCTRPVTTITGVTFDNSLKSDRDKKVIVVQVSNNASHENRFKRRFRRVYLSDFYFRELFWSEIVMHLTNDEFYAKKIAVDTPFVHPPLSKQNRLTMLENIPERKISPLTSVSELDSLLFPIEDPKLSKIPKNKLPSHHSFDLEAPLFPKKNVEIKDSTDVNIFAKEGGDYFLLIENLHLHLDYYNNRYFRVPNTGMYVPAGRGTFYAASVILWNSKTREKLMNVYIEGGGGTNSIIGMRQAAKKLLLRIKKDVLAKLQDNS